MSIEIIDKFIPKNNGDFSIIDAQHVGLNNGEKLDEKLTQVTEDINTLYSLSGASNGIDGNTVVMKQKITTSETIETLEQGQLGYCSDTKELFIGNNNQNDLVGSNNNSSNPNPLVETIQIASPNGSKFSLSISNNGELNIERIIPEIGSEYDGLLINQVYGGGVVGDNKTSVTHSFVELYNSTSKNITLDGLSIQYATKGNSWTVFPLEGVVKSKHSYLIRGARHSEDASSSVSVIIDRFDDEFPIPFYNKGIKILLREGIEAANVANPFNTDGKGKLLSGYIDMIGCGDVASDIDGFEIEPVIGQSKQKSIRRINFQDIHNNLMDCEIVDFRLPEELVKIPKCHIDGPWDENGSLPSDADYNFIKILQVYGGGKSPCACSHDFYELYNMSEDKELNLNELSIYGVGLGEFDGNWQHAKLSGIIKPKHSFLIRGLERTTSFQYEVANFDLSCDMKLNKGMKLFLIKSEDPLYLEGIRNPFDIDGKGTKVEGYIDGFGCGGNSGEIIDGFETLAPSGGDPGTTLVGLGGNSKQTAMRRISFQDTDNNADDFEPLRYANYLVDDELQKKRPRYSGNGAWTTDEEGLQDVEEVFSSMKFVPEKASTISMTFGEDPKKAE